MLWLSQVVTPRIPFLFAPMSNFDIHPYECDPGFDGCVEPFEDFHAPDKAFYSPTMTWDTLPTDPQFMDKTYVSAGYVESTNFYVEDQDNEEHMVISTSLDTEHQESSEYADKLSTSGDAEKLHYDSKHTEYHTATPCTDTLNHNNSSTYMHQQGPWTISHSHTNTATTLPNMWWRDLDIDDKKYEEWARNDPGRAANWEDDWHTLYGPVYLLEPALPADRDNDNDDAIHGEGLGNVDDGDVSHITQGNERATTHIQLDATIATGPPY
ncbi:hypothetical protein K439DRAFT_1614182 [Ramaria rubella]|nr:hypothetical protein K439DRAFT_1614182 [Ramaria rubella]